MPTYSEALARKRQIFDEAETMPGTLHRSLERELRIFGDAKTLDDLEGEAKFDKGRVIDLHEKVEAIILELKTIPLTDEQIKEFYLERLFIAWDNFERKVEELIGNDFDEVKADVERSRRALENLNKLNPGTELILHQDIDGIRAGNVLEILSYEPDDPEHPEEGGMHKVRYSVNGGGELEFETAYLLELIENGEMEPQEIMELDLDEDYLDEVIEEISLEGEEDPISEKARGVLEWLFRSKKVVVPLLVGAIISCSALLAYRVQHVYDEIHSGSAESAEVEREIDVADLIPSDATDRQEMMLTNFFTKIQSEGLDSVIKVNSSQLSGADFLVIERDNGNKITVEYKTSEDQSDFTVITYQVDDDNQISRIDGVEIETSSEESEPELVPGELTDPQQEEVRGNLMDIAQQGADSMKLNESREIVTDLIKLTKTGDNTFTLQYRTSSEGSFKEANYTLDHNSWTLQKSEPSSPESSSEDHDERIKRLRAEKGRAKPAPSKPAATSERASTPDPAPEPAPAEAAPEAPKYYSVKIDDHSQWRINPTEGMSSLEWIPPEGGDWEKPTLEVQKLGQNGIGIYDDESGTYKYIIKLKSDGNFNSIQYRDIFGQENTDTSFDPAKGGATGALFEVRHARPIAAVAQAFGDVRGLGPTPAPRVTPEIAPGFEFAPKYLDDTSMIEQLSAQLEMIDGRIDALNDFIRINRTQFNDHYQEKFKDYLASLNRGRSKFLASVANGQAEHFTFDNQRTYQEEMNYLYNAYKIIHNLTPSEVRLLEDHKDLTKKFVELQYAFINSQNPVEAQKRLAVLRNLTQQANQHGHSLDPFRKVSSFTPIDLSSHLRATGDHGIKQEDIDKLLSNLIDLQYTEAQLQPLREGIARVNENLRLFPEQPKAPKKKITERVRDAAEGAAEDAFGYPELTADQLRSLHADLAAGNGSQAQVREYYADLKTKGPDELKLELDKTYNQLVSLLHQDLGNTSVNEFYTLIERRAAMHAAYNDRLHVLQPDRTRRLVETDTFDDRVFGPGGRGLELGLRDIESRHLQELSIKAFANADNPEWAEIIKALRQEGEYPPKNARRLSRPER